MTLVEVKEQAKALTKAMREQQPDWKLSNSYELLAKNAGYRDWNTYSAKLKERHG